MNTKMLAIDDIWPPVASFSEHQIYIQTYRFERTISVTEIQQSFAVVVNPVRVAVKELADLAHRLNTYQLYLYDLGHDGRLPPDIDSRFEIHRFTIDHLDSTYKYWRASERYKSPEGCTNLALAVRDQRRKELLFQRRLNLLAHLKAAQADLGKRAYTPATAKAEDFIPLASSDAKERQQKSSNSFFAVMRRVFTPAYPQAT